MNEDQYAYYLRSKGQEQLLGLDRLKLEEDLARSLRKREPVVMTYTDTERIGRADRDRYNDHLADLYSKEYLDDAEFGERKDTVASAKTRGELRLALTDLPALPVPVPPVVVEPTKPLVRRAASHIMALPTHWKLVVALFFALAVAIGPSVYVDNVAGGAGNLHGGALVVFVLSIVLGTVGSLITGIGALVSAICEL